jgi:periplasmic protein CpxP/Spy
MMQARTAYSIQPAMRWLAASVLAVAAAVAASPAHAQDRAGGAMLFNGPPEHVARAVDHLLDGLNATDAQRAQIKQIAQAAGADLKAQRDAGRALRERGMQAFAAPTIDATTAESVRQQLVAHHDQASKRVLQAMLDIGQVLTPDQRARIGERMKQRQAMMQERTQRTERRHHDERGERPRP